MEGGKIQSVRALVRFSDDLWHRHSSLASMNQSF